SSLAPFVAFKWVLPRRGGVKNVQVPEFALLDRGLPTGLHPYLRVFPRAAESPGLARIEPDPKRREELLRSCLVHIKRGAGFAYVDVETPCIVLAEEYYRTGTDVDLYLDMLHEITHIRQHHEGRDLWDERYAYVDRITEVEGYAVAVEEGRRLGMSAEEIIAHLSNPWMDEEDVRKLQQNVTDFLDGRLKLP
ncbi:MAG TPA: hypothetical protein VFH78_02950, partial [Candidatus Thermoplasmatota archaeon]|nr:hypothetical protein [Candidatus Thermoplasmatota archaeon]